MHMLLLQLDATDVAAPGTHFALECLSNPQVYPVTPINSAYHGTLQVVRNIVRDNRGVIDGLMFPPPGGGASGIDEILGVLYKMDGGVVNHHYFDLLSAFCVCKKLAVTRAQAAVFKALRNLPRQRTHLFRLSLHTKVSCAVEAHRLVARAFLAPQPIIDHP